MTAKIPKHWKIKKLGDVLEIFPTASYSRSELSDEGEIQYIHYGDIHTKFDSLLEITDDTLPKISKSKGEKYEIILLGDLVMVDASEDYQGVGKSTEVIALSRYNTIAGLHTFLLRDKGEYFCLGYKGYITMSDYVKKQLYIAATGTKVYSLSKESLKLIQLPIPPLKEQEKIAEILLSCDKAIRLTTQIITQLKQRNQGLAQQLLTGEKRVKGFEKSVWKEVKLGEIGEISSAGVDKKVIEGEKPIRLLNYLDVYKRNFIYSDELTHWVTTTDEKIQKCNILQGDVFFTPSSEVRNDIAISAVAIEDIEKAVYSYHIVRLRFKKKIDLNFKAFMFKTDFFFKQAQFLSEGSGTRYVISLSNFRNIKIFLPTYEEQKTIGNILVKAEKELKLYEQKLQLLQAQKKTLMQKLLTGEILTIKK